MKKCSKFCVFKKNAYICNTEKTIKTYDYDRRKRNIQKEKLQNYNYF